MPDVSETAGLLQAFNPSAIPYAAAWIIGSLALVRVLRGVANSLSEQLPKYRLTIKQAHAFISFIIFALVSLIAFNSLFRLSSQVLFALSGTLAVMVGFALKDVASSFMAGISILINKPFQVGDRISFGGYYGEVKEIGMRTVRLVTLDDNLVSIPSNKFLTDPVASANAGELDCMVVMSFYASPDADHSRAKEIVEHAVLASKYLYLGKPIAVLLSNKLLEQGAVVVEITAKAYVFDMRYEKAFASDVTERALKAFRAEKLLAAN
ncbi:MAG: mechanosensitive ion channel [Deltaproteobacteria bacterium]|nr:mechanosensitive ion channel [Deltaproteobacteria bacterium]